MPTMSPEQERLIVWIKWLLVFNVLGWSGSLALQFWICYTCWHAYH